MRDTTSARKRLPLVIWILACVPWPGNAQQGDLALETLPLDEGASTHVSCIIQDRIGFIWVASWSGLHRYDGYSFVPHKHDPDDSSSIATDGLSTVYEDKSGRLWIGSLTGLERFDRETGTFRHFKPNPPAPDNDLSNNVCTICEDKRGELWVGTWGGLYRFDRATAKFSPVRRDSMDPGSIAHNSVQVIYEDKEGSLWFGTAAGLDKYDFASGQFVHCTTVPPESRSLSMTRFAEYSILGILEGEEGALWLVTSRGLVEYDPEHGTSSTYPYVSPQVQVPAFTAAGLNAVCRDPMSASLLVASADGLFTFSKESGLFLHRAQGYITSLYVERSGAFLLGTDTGLLKLNMMRQPFRKYPMGDIACAPTIGRGEALWVFSYTSGYHKFDTRAKQFVPYSFGDEILSFVHLLEKGGTLCFMARDGSFVLRDTLGNPQFTIDESVSFPGLNPKDYARSLSFALETRRGYYFGAHAGGLYLGERKTNRVSLVLDLKQSICWIHEDRQGYLWVATRGGRLVRYDQERDASFEHVHDPNNSSSWNGKQVNWISEDSKAGLWFATTAGALKYDRHSDGFIHFTDKNGLQSNNVRGVAADDHGIVWLSTLKGISRLDPETGRIKNYDASYGLDPAADALYGGVTKAPNGEMYAGGTHGLTGFHPNSIRDNLFVPPIVITSFKKFDKPSPQASEIHLPYDENFISFEFAALSYISPERNQYAYMMEGVDRDWISSGTRRFASYPNLPPGNYVFRVKGSNNEGVWNEAGTSVAMVIAPPWWKTTWAYSAYAALLLGILYLTWKMQVKRIRIAHEYEMSRFEAEKLHEVDEMKSRFFANISHEFRTPLTLILGPAKQIIAELEEGKIREELTVIYRNAIKLLGLVNQLLDVSRLESGTMRLQAVHQNVVPLLRALTLSFASYAERKGIALTFGAREDDIPAYIDQDKIEKVVTNILSNAFKFTPEGGTVEVALGKEDDAVAIRISDTGIGIPAGKIPRIFDRFYQVDGSQKREYEGTGIGLSLAKELVELHKGRIEVESTEGQGTTFVIRLPLGKEHLKPEEICESRPQEAKDSLLPQELVLQGAGKTEKFEAGLIAETGRPLLLIVEDNADVRDYIHDNVKREHRVLEAVDGEDGWNRAVEHMPDVIVSDVMMPKLDGFRLCEKLKADERTSHIPVILLTARASSRDKIEGYETGADDYIMKPFEAEELNARIRNLIEQRKRIHEHFRKHGLLEIDEKKITPVDQKFLQRAIAVVTEHMADSEFGVETFAARMAVSTSVLLKKIEALVGEPPNELVRRTRLNRAAQLIEGRFGNISEIALEVGFTNPSYFAECFRKQFGVTPSHYRRGAAAG